MQKESGREKNSFRLLPLGEQALTVEFGTTIDLETNARVHRLAAALTAEAHCGIRELVPTYRSLLVVFDPLSISSHQLAELIEHLVARSGTAGRHDREPRVIRIPVCYGSEFGPDLEIVADQAGISVEELIALHTSKEFPVYMLGFTPGFPYLGGLPELFVIPRLKSPRKVVPAGSVGIAGNQTGIYPVTSPGGWRIIGRTPRHLFDPERSNPFLLAAGDRVRFDPIDRMTFTRLAADRHEHRNTSLQGIPDGQEKGTISVVKPGMFTTVQDRGRSGFLAYGVPASGAMDRMASRTANILAGNDPEAAFLEMTLHGGTFNFEQETFVAVCGADMGGRLNGAPIRNWSGFFVPAGSELSFGHAKNGCRAYLAVRGGIATPQVLGSRSTLHRAGIGGMGGRALCTGDRLPLVTVAGIEHTPRILTRRLVPDYPGDILLRVLPGPQDDYFTAEGLTNFFSAAYTVTSRNDRMGYCLDGPPISHLQGADITSDALCAGAVQVPGNGLPIIMTADHQTTGGYAKIATIIGPDLFKIAQARQGMRVSFVRCSHEEAIQTLRHEEAFFESIRQSPGNKGERTA